MVQMLYQGWQAGLSWFCSVLLGVVGTLGVVGGTPHAPVVEPLSIITGSSALADLGRWGIASGGYMGHLLPCHSGMLASLSCKRGGVCACPPALVPFLLPTCQRARRFVSSVPVLCMCARPRYPSVAGWLLSPQFLAILQAVHVFYAVYQRGVGVCLG